MLTNVSIGYVFIWCDVLMSLFTVGIIEPNLDHLGLAFRDFHVNLSDLEEYVTYVNFGQGPTAVPKFPLPKEDHLNFLKPGSKEVVTRPVYIHEHLPPMYPLLEGKLGMRAAVLLEHTN